MKVEARCDRHVGDPYPPRCFDCEREAAEAREGHPNAPKK